MRKCTLAAVSLAVALTVPNVASAGGLFLSEFGTEDVALAGAGWAARPGSKPATTAHQT